MEVGLVFSGISLLISGYVLWTTRIRKAELRLAAEPPSYGTHFYDHGVTETEVEWILGHPGEDEACADDSRQAPGQTDAGRL